MWDTTTFTVQLQFQDQMQTIGAALLASIGQLAADRAFRGRIKEVRTGVRRAVVSLIDFGDEAEVELVSIRDMPQQVAQIEPQARDMKLARVAADRVASNEKLSGTPSTEQLVIFWAAAARLRARRGRRHVPSLPAVREDALRRLWAIGVDHHRPAVPPRGKAPARRAAAFGPRPARAGGRLHRPGRAARRWIAMRPDVDH
jgi:hypothetical protein